VRFPPLPVALLVALVAACAPPPFIAGTPLRVASDIDNPPFAALAADGTPVGREVEMMEQVGRALGRPIEWVRMPFDELVSALEVGDADVLCATFGVTPERAHRVAFTQPYFGTSIAIVCRAGANEPRSRGDLAGKRVAAALGTTSERAVRQRLPGAIGVFENKAELPTDERLLTGAVDAAVMDGPAADALVEANSGRLVRLDDTLGAEFYALAVHPERDDLLVELNAALKAMDGSGAMSALNARFRLVDAR